MKSAMESCGARTVVMMCDNSRVKIIALYNIYLNQF